MKIAIATEFCTPYYQGGGEIRYNEIYKRLVKREHEAYLVCYKFKDALHPTMKGGLTLQHRGPVIENPPKRSTWDFIHYTWSCFWYLMREDYDVIDANTYIPLLPAFVASKLRRKPMMATINIIMGEWKGEQYNPYMAKFIEKVLFKLPFTKVLTVSEYAKTQLTTQFGLNSDKISVVHNGVDFKTIDSIKEKAKPNRVIFVGRLISWKNVDDLIVACVLLKKDIPNLELVIVGDGQEMPKLKTKARAHKWIKLVGSLPYEETIREIKKSSLLVLPSTKDTFGMVLAEAMACSKPVVAYNVGGPAEIITEDCGLLAEPNNRKELSEKIGFILGNKKLSTIMGKNARKRAKKTFDWDKIAVKIEKELEAII